MTPACSIALLAPVYVHKWVLAYKSTDYSRIGALSGSIICIIYEIVSNFRHDLIGQLPVRQQKYPLLLIAGFLPRDELPADCFGCPLPAGNSRAHNVASSTSISLPTMVLNFPCIMIQICALTET